MSFPMGGEGDRRADVGAFQLNVWSTFEIRDELYEGSDRVGNRYNESLQLSQTFFDIQYTFDPAWAVSATFNYTDIFWRAPGLGPPGQGPREREQGLGDTTLQFHWTLVDDFLHKRTGEGGDADELPYAAEDWLREPRLRVRASFGSTLPTGDVKQLPENPNPLGTPVTSLQLGIGTFNPMIGGQARVDWGGLAASLDAVGVIPFYENRHDLQAGAFQKYSLTGEVLPLEDVRLALGLEAEHRERDEIDGEAITVGGGWRYLLHPQAVLSPWENVHVFLGMSYPIYRRFETQQVDYGKRWEFGFLFRF